MTVLHMVGDTVTMLLQSVRIYKDVAKQNEAISFLEARK